MSKNRKKHLHINIDSLDKAQTLTIKQLENKYELGKATVIARVIP